MGFNKFYALLCATIFNWFKATASSNIGQFDPIEARRFFDFAAASYTIHVDKCLSLIPGNFTLVWKKKTSCDWNSKCFAFMAISPYSNAIVVAFRGSSSNKMVIKEALENLGTLKRSFLGGSVYRFFYNAYRSFQPELRRKLKCLIRNHPTYDLWVTGHSLGGAIASIFSAKILDKKIIDADKLRTIVFGMPRVGTYNYARNYDKLHKHSFRVVHRKDVVPHLPPCFSFHPSTDCFGLRITTYPYHHGVEVWYDNDMTSEHSNYKICLGMPKNEDRECSNSVAPMIKHSLRDHVNYYGVHVSTYGKEGCLGPKPPPAPPPPEQPIKWGIRLWGHYQESLLFTAEDCREKCTSDPGCNAMTFSLHNLMKGWNSCYLFATYERRTSENLEWATWFKSETPPVPPPPPPEQPIIWGTRLWGHYSESILYTAEQCRDKCANDQVCRAMTFSSYNLRKGWNSCYLYITFNRQTKESLEWATWFKTATQDNLNTFNPEIDDDDFVYNETDDEIDHYNYTEKVGQASLDRYTYCDEKGFENMMSHCYCHCHYYLVCPYMWDDGVCLTNVTFDNSANYSSNEYGYNPDMTMEWCHQFCGENNYRIAAVWQSTICRCALSFTEEEPVVSTACNLPCHGNLNQICGGNTAMSVWTTISDYDEDDDNEENETASATIHYITTLTSKTVATSSETSQTLTSRIIPSSITTSNVLTTTSKTPMSSALTVTSKALTSAMTTPSKAITTSKKFDCKWSYRGCYGNNPWNVHALVDGANYIRPGNLTVEMCETYCIDQIHYRFASLDYGNACHCGTGVLSNATKGDDAKYCTMPCPGNNLQMCGGPWVNSVYECV